ncbi:MAG TPA: LysM peptidoglycan-binding domain-containing protein, partial [bacterium]|nr:LysM peptidoglycan-binding domain-containing protein [bacterium]
MRAKFCFCLLLLPLCLAAETVVSHYHRVQPGETLSTISKRYNISLSLLMKQNNLSSTSVQAGQRLLVQKKTLEVTGSASQKSAGRKKRRTYSTRKNDGSNPAAGTSLSYYTVKRGDSLATISRKTGVSVSQIKRLNGLKGSLLTIGQRLKIKSSPVFVSPEVQPRPILPGREKVYYRVQAGDTLESIAEQFGIPAETLRES